MSSILRGVAGRERATVRNGGGGGEAPSIRCPGLPRDGRAVTARGSRDAPERTAAQSCTYQAHAEVRCALEVHVVGGHGVQHATVKCGTRRLGKSESKSDCSSPSRLAETARPPPCHWLGHHTVFSGFCGFKRGKGPPPASLLEHATGTAQAAHSSPVSNDGPRG